MRKFSGIPTILYHRIDIRRSSRHVKVGIGGETVADTRRPVLLFETGLPVRYYIQKIDVRMELLVPSEKQSYCAYKGSASYYSVNVGDSFAEDIVWYYPYPNPQYAEIQNYLCFYDEKADKFSVQL